MSVTASGSDAPSWGSSGWGVDTELSPPFSSEVKHERNNTSSPPIFLLSPDREEFKSTFQLQETWSFSDQPKPQTHLSI
jgi:hypothetical protein